MKKFELKHKGMNYLHMLEIHAALTCQKDVEMEEAQLFLDFLQELGTAMMAQLAILKRYRVFYSRSITGLEMDIDENNREIERVKNYIQSLLKFKSN